MPRELADFYTDVLVELGVTGPDRAASAEDLAVVTDAYVPMWALLETRGLVTWLQTDAIPDAALMAMRWIAAFHLARSFGVTGPKLDDLRQRGEIDGPAPSLGERMLRKNAAAPYIPATLPVDFY